MIKKKKIINNFNKITFFEKKINGGNAKFRIYEQLNILVRSEIIRSLGWICIHFGILLTVFYSAEVNLNITASA